MTPPKPDYYTEPKPKEPKYSSLWEKIRILFFKEKILLPAKHEDNHLLPPIIRKSTSNSTQQRPSAQKIYGNLQTPSKSCYVPSASMTDILYDQLEHLINHQQNCTPDCFECKRLQNVKDVLLLPFRKKFIQ